ncbi:MAG TPA: hypothetical protein VJZ68_06355 [Nitrososphaera sp.]|nr:hypothetical protein [Nitrososphaera sp.]
MNSKSRFYVSLLSIFAVRMVAMASLATTSAELVPDENGVMMYDYGRSIGKVYNPKVATQQEIKNYDDY